MRITQIWNYKENRNRTKIVERFIPPWKTFCADTDTYIVVNLQTTISVRLKLDDFNREIYHSNLWKLSDNMLNVYVYIHITLSCIDIVPGATWPFWPAQVDHSLSYTVFKCIFISYDGKCRFYYYILFTCFTIWPFRCDDNSIIIIAITYYFLPLPFDTLSSYIMLKIYFFSLLENYGLQTTCCCCCWPFYHRVNVLAP